MKIKNLTRRELWNRKTNPKTTLSFDQAGFFHRGFMYFCIDITIEPEFEALRIRGPPEFEALPPK